MRILKPTVVRLVLLGMLAPPGLAPLALAGPPSVLITRPTDLKDTARVYKDGRLRKTDEEFTNEQDTIACGPPAADGSMNCLECGMRTGALENGKRPPHHMQCACTPVTIAADGSMAISGESKFVTDNDGNEYRNCNKPTAMAINGGDRFLFMFNYQPDGSNDTRRYAKVLDAKANPLTVKDSKGKTRKQVEIMYKKNDDCDMHQDGIGPCSIASDNGSDAHLACWAGCNGNGDDDGWLNDINVNCSASSCTITKNFDISLCQREERSRGHCNVAASDPNTAVCSWTEGNNQPQEDGVWLAAVDISPGGKKGENVKSRLLWKKRIEHRVKVDGKNLYAQRMKSGPVLSLDANGNPVATNQLFLSYGLHTGGNRNEEKGGTYYRAIAMVVEANRQGYTTVVPKTDITNLMLGIDYTHNTFSPVLFGAQGDLLPGFTLLNGSHNGGLASVGAVKSIGFDAASKSFLDLGNSTLGTGVDRHLYSNYLGNNPGVQGRNFQGSLMVKNPRALLDANAPAFALLHAVSGKTASNPATIEMKYKPDQKLVMNALDNPPVLVTNALPLTAEGNEAAAMGCSASGKSSTGTVTLLALAGLLAFLRRKTLRSVPVLASSPRSPLAVVLLSSSFLIACSQSQQGSSAEDSPQKSTPELVTSGGEEEDEEEEEAGGGTVSTVDGSNLPGAGGSAGSGGGSSTADDAGTPQGGGSGTSGGGTTSPGGDDAGTPANGSDAGTPAGTGGGGTGATTGGGTAPTAAANKALFESTVRPILRNNGTAKCAVCHVPTGLSSLKFLAADPANDYATIISYASVVGTFDKKSAPILTSTNPPNANHALVAYAAGDVDKIGAWLDAEFATRNAPPTGGTGDGGTTVTPPPPGPGQIAEKLMGQFSGCMELTTWNDEKVASRWANLDTDEGRCKACHINGDGMFVATDESQRMFNIVSTSPAFFRQFFTANVADPANAKVEINLNRVNAALSGQGLHIQHPRYSKPLDNSATKALQQFYDKTMERVRADTAGTIKCEPSRLR